MENLLLECVDYWTLTLKNNIILDASSKIDGVYQLSDHYRIIGEKRIIDHSESLFNIVPFNTSKSHLNKNKEEFFKEVSNKIIANNDVDERTLIICHKENHLKVEHELLRLGVTDIHIAKESIIIDDEIFNEEKITERYAINWFGNIIGKNVYADFSNCWIIGTPNIPVGHYLMHYMMYTQQKNLTNKSVVMKKGIFANEEFNKVQTGYVASEIYQCLKRIQRNFKPNGKFFIVNKNQKIIDLVLSQIKGHQNKVELQLQFALKPEIGNRSNYIDIFIDYMEKVEIREYPKKEICEKLGIKNLSRVLKAERVKALVDHGFIKVKRFSIEKLINWS